MKRFFSVPTAKGLCGTKRSAMMLLAVMMFTMTAQTAWAAEWPSYITDVVLVGGTEQEAQNAKSGYSGYTWCDQKLNEGKDADIIYIGYKTSTSANTNGGYITDFIIIDAGTGTEGHNPPSSLTFQGHTYYLCPAAGGSYFVNSNHGNLTSQAASGWNMYLYYTKENFSDKRAVSSIDITKGEDTKSGAINCYYKDGRLHEKEISLNRGVSGTPFVYMHISTETKVNRPNPEPKTITGQTYDGTPKNLISLSYTNYNSGTVYYRVGNTGSYTSDVNSLTRTDAGQYYVWYYSGASDYGNSSLDYRHYKVVKIAKSPNSGATVTCTNHFEGTATAPEISGTNLSTGAITYKYSTSQKGTYTTTAPSEPGTYWVKATIASDNNCDEYTTAATSFNIIYDWRVHNSGENENDAYVISTIADLKYLAVWVNSGYNDYAGKYFKLGDNIAFDKSTENNFPPIGNSTHPFKGIFDGNGKTISGLNINKPNNDYVGLFGKADGATIKNLTLTNSTITGCRKVGAILGDGYYSNTTTVENCLVTNGVEVSGQANEAGGIVGASATIRGCVSAASVSGDESFGGIIGNGNLSTVTNCLYTGTSISNNTTSEKGAIVGYKGSGNFSNNYYTADLACKGANGADADGARKAVAINAANGVTVTPTGNATAYNVSGITAYAGNSSIKYTVGNSTVIYAGDTETVSLDITYNIDGFSVTGYTDGNGNALTHVSGNTYTLTMTADAPTVTPVGSDVWGITTAGRDGSAEHPYLITTTEGLDLLAKRVNGIDGYSANTFSGTYFELGNDITYNGSENNYTAIGTSSNPFSGIFDGKGHTVSGIRINANANKQGLFGYISGSGCEVKNITVTDATIIIGGNYQGAGSIAGRCDDNAVIENCHATEDVRVAGVSQAWIIGGIVGNNFGYVRGCTSTATVSVENRSAGAIVGSNCKTIENCLVLGASVSGTQEVGAIVGYNYNGTLTNNHYTSATTVNGAAGTDVDGATFAYEFPAANYAMGAVVSTYAADTNYEGITVYDNGLAYNGKYYSQDPWGGRGTEYDPYVIYNTAGMDKLASEVNGGNEYKYTYFVLGSDIDYDKTKENNYIPIGDNQHPFYGNFDGQGHTISGIRISDTDDFTGVNKAIFGKITGTVKNLVVSDCCIEACRTIGGIVALLFGTIENCHVLSDVTLTGHSYIGGIAAENYWGTVKGCTSAATIIGTEDNGSNAGWLGGIAGSSGENRSTLTDNLFTGTISGNLLDYIGAILGKNDYDETTLTNNYHTLSGKGGVGSGGSAIGSDEDGAFLAVSSTTKPGDLGEATTTYGKDDYIGITAYQYGLYYNGQYYDKDPSIVIWSGKGTAENPYVIRTTDELDLLASDVNNGIDYRDTYFVLGADIAYSYDGLGEGESNYTPIGDNLHYFGGTFDGKGHTISGIRISDINGQNKAIFGWVRGTVKNLIVSDCSIEAYQNIGGIVSDLQGIIENCHVGSDVTLSGSSYIGGIASNNDGGTIIGCTSAATIIGTVDGGMNAKWLGGIVGYAAKYGSKTPTLTDNLFTGTISGLLRDHIGAIVGKNNRDVTILNNNYHTCSGMGGVGNEDDATSSDVDGATIAYELPEANAAMGAPGSTYAAGTDYEGITVFENGLAYNGQFYSPSPWGGSGTENDPYVIYTTEGLDLLASNVNSGNMYNGKFFTLGADIAYDKTALTLDLDGNDAPDSNFPGIGAVIDPEHLYPFVGSLDGRGHTISGIVVNRPNCEHVGLFGIAIGGYIKNLTLANSDITGSQNVGAIAGEGCNIENCHVANDVTVRGEWSVGGIVGMRANLQGCTSSATVNGIELVGGILGDGNNSTVRDCLYLGNSVTANNGYCVGAIVGSGDNTTLENNYHTCYGLGGVGSYDSAPGGDVDGARFAVSNTMPPASIDPYDSPTAVYSYTVGTDQYIGITAYSPNGLYYKNRYYWHEVVKEIPLTDYFENNSQIIEENDGNTVNVLLAGRTFHKDGKWSTIFLPFDVDLTDPDCPLQGAIIRTVTDIPENNENAISGTTLNLTFGEKQNEEGEEDILMAGVPYLIRWDRPDDYEGNESMYDIVDPLFIGVKITYGNSDFWSDGGVVGFEGDYNCMEDVFISYPEEYDVLLLGDDNNLHYATPGESLGACRAFIIIDRSVIGNSNFRLTDYVFDLGNGEMLSGILSQHILPGDVNNDGKVTPADAIMILYDYFGVQQTEFNREAADLNGDHAITPADAIEALYRYFGAGSGNGNARSLRPATNGGQDPE